MNSWKVTIDEEARTAEFSGVTFGYGIGNTLELWSLHFGKKLMVCKRKGCREWSSRAESNYYPAEFKVYKIVTQISTDVLEVEELIDFPIMRERQALGAGE